jgi:hypothetical protein
MSNPKMHDVDALVDRLQREWGLQYWATVHYGRRPIGYTLDWYPEEVQSHKRNMEREGAEVTGPFGTREEARQAVHLELEHWCKKGRKIEKTVASSSNELRCH